MYNCNEMAVVSEYSGWVEGGGGGGEEESLCDECHAEKHKSETYKSVSDTNGDTSFIIYTLTPHISSSSSQLAVTGGAKVIRHSPSKGKVNGDRRVSEWVRVTDWEQRKGERGMREREEEEDLAICMSEYCGASTHTQVTHWAIWWREWDEWMHVKSNVYIRSRFILIMQLIKSRKQESTSEYVVLFSYK